MGISNKKKVDKPFLISLIILVVAGFFIFSSASLGLLSSSSSTFNSVTFNQIVFGLILGGISCVIASYIPFQFWKKNSFWIFLFSCFTMILVFIPGLEFYHGGAHRWFHIGSFNVQPAEFYKIGVVFYLAAWFTSVKDKASTFKYGTLPFIIITVISAGLLLAQPDTDTFFVVSLAGLGIFLTAGGKWRDIFSLILVGIVCLVVLAFARPYVMQRIKTFMDPASDPLGSGYQVQQSLIAIGSGGMVGRGFGQSIQKFSFLPEPIGDSIFAVAAEEFGFIGSVAIILLYLFFTFRGFKIAGKVQDSFGRLVTVGIVILIISQSLINMAAMLAIMPLSGTPLIFISHGGTAMLFALFSVGIVLNISRFQSQSQSQK